jgi:hypothetical protein
VAHEIYFQQDSGLKDTSGNDVKKQLKDNSGNVVLKDN